MKSNPDIYQAMVLGKTEDKLNFKLADIDMKITEKTCLKRNTAKIEKVNERALRYIFKDKSASY